MAVQGIQRVRAQVGKVFAYIKKEKTHDGLYAILQQGSILALTITPQDTGALANSLSKPQISGASGSVGFLMEYAKWVHEMPGTLKGQPRGNFGRMGNHSAAGPQQMTPFGGGTGKGNYWDPNAEPHFMTKGFDQLVPSIPKILERVYRV